MTSKSIWISPKIEVRHSPRHGFGVFAREAIAVGEILEHAHCFRIPREHYHRIEFVNQHLGGYFFSWPKFDGDQVALVLGFGSIYNHADEPNANWETDIEHDYYVFTAVADIAADEEICISYGQRWWEARKHTIAPDGAQ